jgi:hypothetical protein
LCTAIELVGAASSLGWAEHYELMLELHTFLCEMYLSSGQLDKILRVSTTALKNKSNNVKEMLQIQLVLLTRLSMLSKMTELVDKSMWSSTSSGSRSSMLNDDGYG